VQGRVVALLPRQREELVGVLQARVEVAQVADYELERFLFLAQVLGTLGVVPDARIFQFRVDGVESLRLDVEVKDTSADPRCDAADRRDCWRWR